MDPEAVLTVQIWHKDFPMDDFEGVRIAYAIYLIAYAIHLCISL